MMKLKIDDFRSKLILPGLFDFGSPHNYETNN